MSLRITMATAQRVLRQIRHDPRTVALLLVVPALLCGLFPFIVMFLVTSIAMLRERRCCASGRPGRWSV